MVPCNRMGMIELMEDTALVGDETENIRYFPLSSEEYQAIMPLLRQYERAFGFDSEGGSVEQLIDTRSAPIALELAASFLAAAETPAAKAASRAMAEALEYALKCGSFVEFSLDTLQ